MTKPLCSYNHVARYCSATRLSNGFPMPAAFELRDDEDFLSSNWIEYFGMMDLELGMNKVREEVCKHHSTTENGRFAILNVGEAKKTISHKHGVELRIEDLEEKDYPSHTGIWFPRDVLGIALALSEMIKQQDMHSGINQPSTSQNSLKLNSQNLPNKQNVNSDKKMT